MIETFEAAVVARLKEKLPTLEVRSFPDDSRNYRLEHPVGALLVRYGSSKYTQPLATDVVVQDSTMIFSVTVVTRGYNTDGGAKAIIKQTEDALRGYKVAGCTKIWIAETSLLDETEGIWQYEIGISAVTRVCECGGERDKIEFNEQTGEYGDDFPRPV